MAKGIKIRFFLGVYKLAFAKYTSNSFVAGPSNRMFLLCTFKSHPVIGNLTMYFIACYSSYTSFLITRSLYICYIRTEVPHDLEDNYGMLIIYIFLFFSVCYCCSTSSFLLRQLSYYERETFWQLFKH